MKQYTVTLSNEEEKALLVDVVSIQEWLDNAIHNKARQCIDKVVREYSDKQPSKITNQEKNLIVRAAKVETAIERNKKAQE